MTANYLNAFITASPDSRATHGTEPARAESVAGIQHILLRDAPYGFTSDDLLFEVHARRNNVDASSRDREREAFFRKSHACLRASPLVKQYGWGLHHDENGRVAIHGVETDEYRTLASRSDLKIVAGIRSRKS